MKRLLLLLALLPFAVNAQVVTPPNAVAMVCANNTVVPTPTDGKFFYVQCDSSGRLITNGGSASGSIPATANITEYVATTGSDTGAYANCQAVAHPCATIQHAVNVATLYNYVGLYTPTINVADGTYAVNGTQPAVTLLPLVNYPFGKAPTIVGNTTTPANVVVSNTSGDAVATASGANWNMTGFRFKSTSGANCDLNATGGAVSINDATGNAGTGKIDFAGNYKLMCAIGGGAINAFSQTITISSTSFAYMAYGFTTGFIPVDGSTITFPGVSTTVSQYVVSLADNAVFGNPTFVNGSNVVGNKFWIGSFSYLEYSGTVASFPGNGSTYVWALAQYWGDNSVRLTDYSGNLWGDYNATTAGQWTFQNNMELTTTATGCLGYKFTQGGGGHAIEQLLAGSGGCFGLAAGQNGWIDYSTGSYLVWYGSGAAPSVTFAGVIGVTGVTGTYGAGAADVGLSRLGADSWGFGNGTAGDTSATITAAHATLVSLANSATTSALCYNTSTHIITYDGTVGTCTTSDETLKNIGPRIDDALNRLLKINGFYFTWKDPAKYGQGRQIGVGAQTVEKVFPELVQTGSDGLKSVDYVHMIGPIIEAMRELKHDNDNLHACQESWTCRLFGP